MARRPPPPHTLKRRKERIEPKVKLVVFCEGANTEPQYLKDFAFAWGNRLVHVHPIPAAGVPLTLIRSACDEKKRLDRQAAKEDDSFSSHFQVWGLFDVDDHPNISQAKNLATARGIRICISNPCFDLWGILHYQQHDAEEHRHLIQKRLAKLMTSYDPKGSKEFNYEEIHGSYAKAKTHAKELLRRRSEEANAGGNPSTNVYELLDLIILYGKSIK